jgi:hypothetical protein
MLNCEYNLLIKNQIDERFMWTNSVNCEMKQNTL